MATALQPLVAKAPLWVAIRTGGIWVAEALAGLLDPNAQVAVIDTSFHRDDVELVGLHPGVQPSDLPGGVDGRHVLLIDDVLFTGRSVRAALDELFDYGRPASVTLAVLIDRGGRELPIHADVVGATITLPRDRRIVVRGPQPLRTVIEPLSPERRL